MFALALVLILLAAPAAAGPGPRATLVVTSPQAPASRPPATFQATRVLDVEMTVAFARALAGDHVLELKTYTPLGHLYQVITVPFTGIGPAARRPGYRRVRGYPRPLLERTLRSGPAGFQVSAALPVAGTWIVTNALYGRWRVDAFLDGHAAPVARAAFTIAP